MFKRRVVSKRAYGDETKLIVPHFCSNNGIGCQINEPRNR